MVVVGCFVMATMASVSAQQIGNLQGQPSGAPLEIDPALTRLNFVDRHVCNTPIREDRMDQRHDRCAVSRRTLVTAAVAGAGAIALASREALAQSGPVRRRPHAIVQLLYVL